ncbi:MAG: hypothetical protein DHS20C01_14750 [marine bacterium B5-7]|nr:MAG: hypothetical protein DHS20C01_14750 [marine bacterium B5-7]
MERYLDVSELEAPEPLERILTTIESLQQGEFLHVYHRRDPLPLYPLLQDRGCRWQSGRDNKDMIHVFIWYADDSAAENQADEGVARCIRI